MNAYDTVRKALPLRYHVNEEEMWLTWQGDVTCDRKNCQGSGREIVYRKGISCPAAKYFVLNYDLSLATCCAKQKI